jgi:hypothetical protein
MIKKHTSKADAVEASLIKVMPLLESIEVTARLSRRSAGNMTARKSGLAGRWSFSSEGFVGFPSLHLNRPDQSLELPGAASAS